MKKIILTVFLITFAYSCSKNRNCADFKTGTFAYSDKRYKNWVITRTETQQVETDTLNKIRLVGTVQWSSECELSLTYIEVSDSTRIDLIGQTIDVELLESNTNRIKYIAKLDNHTYTSEMVKVE